MKTLRDIPLLLPLLGWLTGFLLNYFFPLSWEAWPILVLGTGGLVLSKLLGTYLPLIPAGKWILRESSLFVIAFALGALWNTHSPGQEAEGQTTLPKGTYYLVGNIAKPLKQTQYGSKCWLNVWAISEDGNCWEPWSGKLLTYFSKQDTLSSLLQFDTLHAAAYVQPVRSQNEGFRNYLLENGIHLQAQVKKYQPGGKGRSLSARLYQLQHKLGHDLENLLTDPALIGIAKAMFLGDKNDLDKEVRQQFSVAGLSHILAISGMHVGIVALILGLFSNIFPGSSWSRKLADALVLLMLAVYVLLTGAGPAVVRAGIMFGAVLLARMFYLRTRILNVVAFAALLQLLYDPKLLFSPGFQLSYAAVIMLVLFYPRFANWVKTPWWLLNRCFDLLGVSLLATLATGPLVYHYFGALPTYFLLSNLLVGPILFVLVAGGFITVLICLIDPVIAQVPAWTTEQLLKLLHQVSVWVSELPHASITFDSWQNPALGILFLQLGLAFLWFLLPRLFLLIARWEGSFSRSFLKS